MEADLIFVAPDEVGRVETLSVKEGDQVETGAPLFTVDADLQKADLRDAAGLAHQCAAGLRSRPRAAQDQRRHAEDPRGCGSGAAHRAGTVELLADAARPPQASQVPVTGSVEQIYFRVGEMVPAGKPVVALLPPGNLKVRFFVNEALLPQIKLGDMVKVHCDGCAGDLTAKVSFIARSSEFTPPVIYSLDERSKLVFLIEARPRAPGDAARRPAGERRAAAGNAERA